MNVSFENVVEVRNQMLFLQLSNNRSILLCYMPLKMDTGTLRKLFCVYIRVNGKDYETNILGFVYLFCQILEAAHRIGASDMKKHALDLVVGHFGKVIKTVREGPD